MPVRDDVLRPTVLAFATSRDVDRPEGGLISVDEHIRDRVLRFGLSLELQEILIRLGLSRKTLWEKNKNWGLS